MESMGHIVAYMTDTNLEESTSGSLLHHCVQYRPITRIVQRRHLASFETKCYHARFVASQQF